MGAGGNREREELSNDAGTLTGCIAMVLRRAERVVCFCVVRPMLRARICVRSEIFYLLDLLGRGARCNWTAGGRAAHSRHSLLASFLVLAVGLLVRSPTGLLIQYEVLRVSPYRFGKDVRLGWLGVL